MSSSLTSVTECFLVDYIKPLFKSGPLLAVGWETALRDHPDKQYIATILGIIKFGDTIGYTGPKQLILIQTLPAGNNAPDVLTQDLV